MSKQKTIWIARDDDGYCTSFASKPKKSNCGDYYCESRKLGLTYGHSGPFYGLRKGECAEFKVSFERVES